jgi:hypothetical protein
MPEHALSEISQSVFQTVLYSDVFDFPLTAPEIHRYLSGRAATYEDVCRILSSDPRFIAKGPYFALEGRGETINLRETRALRSRELLPHAFRYGQILGLLPFVRMVALTGSLAVGNISENEDFDYMLVTEPGRLWTARAFVLLLNRLTRLAGYTLCPNVMITKNALEWAKHDLYSARDLCQMIPLAGRKVYSDLIQANRWVRDVLPNAYDGMMNTPGMEEKKRLRSIQAIIEFILGGRLGDHFERWEMNRKIERFSRQEGFSDETVFNAHICQGNFDHHRRWTRQEFGKRGGILNKEDSGEEKSLEIKSR